VTLKLPRFQQTQPSWSLLRNYLNKFAASIESNDAAQELQIEQLELAINTANAIMPDIAPITITADYTGTVNTGQLPRSIRAYRYNGSTDVSDDATWSVDASAGITASVDLTGLVTITAISASGTIVVTSDHNDIERSKTIVVTLETASAPSTGTGGGTSSTDTSFASFNSTTFATVSDELTVTVGSSGEVQLTAPLMVYTDEAGASGSFDVKGIWQWWDGGAWVDQGTESSSHPDCSYLGGMMNEGSLVVAYLRTGLAAASSQRFRLQARNNSGTRIMYLSGEASAVAV
jgi:hypothetical protein